jgi:endonuclease IV
LNISLATNRDVLRLVHYNDSAVACGEYVDRHARVGSGHIGAEKMIRIAEICHREKIPMLTE